LQIGDQCRDKRKVGNSAYKALVIMTSRSSLIPRRELRLLKAVLAPSSAAESPSAGEVMLEKSHDGNCLLNLDVATVELPRFSSMFKEYIWIARLRPWNDPPVEDRICSTRLKSDPIEFALVKSQVWPDVYIDGVEEGVVPFATDEM
jgi:hypothetical protein